MENFLQHPSIPHKIVSKNGAEMQCLAPAAASWLVCSRLVTVHKCQRHGAKQSPGLHSRLSLYSSPYLMSPHFTKQSLPIHWCSGSSPLVLLSAHWPRHEMPVGFIYLSCGLPWRRVPGSQKGGMKTSVLQACKVGQS